MHLHSNGNDFWEFDGFLWMFWLKSDLWNRNDEKYDERNLKYWDRKHNFEYEIIQSIITSI